GEAMEGEFSIEPAGSGSTSILLNGRSYLVTQGTSGEVVVNGWIVQAEAFDPRDLRVRNGRASGHGPQQLTPPMPGKSGRVLVTVGEDVEAGQGLVVVEAMKMQNEMKSARAGKVKEVRAVTGTTVVAGEVLVVVE